MKLLMVCFALMLQSSVIYAQWTIQPSPSTETLWSVRIATAANMYSCGDKGTLLKSTNGGTEWTTVFSPLTASFRSVSMIGDTGFFFGNGGSTLWTNRGANPAAIRNYSIPDGTPYPLSSHIFGSFSAIACGEFWTPSPVGVWNGYVVSTTNAGFNWTIQVHDSLRSLQAIRFYDAANGVMIGKRSGGNNASVLLRTSDRGISWSSVPIGFTDEYSALCVIDSVHWVIGCKNGALLVSTDGGGTWARYQYSVNGIPLTSMITSVASTQQVIYFTTGMQGYSGGIFRSVDLGQTVQQVYSGGQALRSIAVTDSGSGIAVGDSGYIVRMVKGTTAVINGQERSVKGFSLGQNYPNPFNPSTTIPFQLHRAGDVTIRIYDRLGREVAVVADGYRDAGTHSVRWDADGVSSGAYVMRLSMGSQMETRTIVLVR